MEASVHPDGVYADLVRAFDGAALSLLKRERDRFIDVACTACGSSNGHRAFSKIGYLVRECDVCGSLFTSPRPTPELMSSYLENSAAAAFRTGEDYRDAMASRTWELARDRADWIALLCDRVCPASGPIVVFEPAGPELMNAILATGVGPVVAVRPLFAARNGESGHSEWEVVDDLGSERAAGSRVIGLFDVLERQVKPVDVLNAARETLAPGGCLAVTTRCGGGFDIQVAWERATVFPIEHMNLPTVEGMERLLQRVGLEVLEMSTPGQLDVQMVERLSIEEGAELPRFLQYFLGKRGQRAKSRLQRFLQQNLLSSHLRLVAQRAA